MKEEDPHGHGHHREPRIDLSQLPIAKAERISEFIKSQQAYLDGKNRK